MNPPEQAPALKQIYEARLELVRQNEAEIADLKTRLQQAVGRQENLVIQMNRAKANYEEAASKIVDLLDDNDEKVEYDGGDNSTEQNGNHSTTAQNSKSKERRRGKTKDVLIPQSRKGERDRMPPSRTPSPLKPIPRNYPQQSMADEVVDLLDSDDNTETESNEEGNRTTRLAHGDNKKKPKRSLSPKTNSSDDGNSESVSKRRASSSAAMTRRIKVRPRPSDVPPERWLKSSVGRTRQELNNIDDMVQYMGSCQFGQSVVVSKFGEVHAIVLNDEWNLLAQRNDEYQFWYVGLGPGRKRDARLVGASQTSIPIFHAPKMQYNTKELFYVGHYRVKDIEELNPPLIEMEKERDMKVTFAFEKFDKRLDSIIQKGPSKDG